MEELFDKRVIPTLASRDIAKSDNSTANENQVRKDLVKCRVKKILDRSDPKELKKIVMIGDYKDIRPLTLTSQTGKISIRMVLSIAEVLKINPYYLTGESSEFDLYEDVMKEFLKEKGYGYILEDQKCESVLLEKKAISFMKSIAGSLTINEKSYMDSMDKEHIMLFLETYFEKSKSKEDKIGLDIIKMILLKG